MQPDLPVSDVVYIPVEAVFRKDDRTIAYCIEDGKRAASVDVTVGKRNDTYVVIEAGLFEGDVVALEDPIASQEIVEAL